MNADLLRNTKIITKNFIELNYSEELPFFDAFWDVFSKRVRDFIKTNTGNNLILKPGSQIINQVSFSSMTSNDFKTPIAALTIFEVINISAGQDYTTAQLEDVVHSVAAKYKAMPSLAACLLKHLRLYALV